MIERALAGLLLSVIVAGSAWRVSALTGLGAVVAVGVGTAIAVGASWPGLLVLGAFFISSSALSNMGKRNVQQAKGSRRDAWQVLANGGVAALAALLASGDRHLALAFVAGALAAAAADTWATEIGGSSATEPRLLLSRRVVPRGTSGGVTRRGLLASVLGATFIGCVAGAAAAVSWSLADGLTIAGIVAVAGVVGSLTDSILGETIQERRMCPTCSLGTELTVHGCGAETVHVGGVRFMTNDVVNLACTVAGALVGGMALLV